MPSDSSFNSPQSLPDIDFSTIVDPSTVKSSIPSSNPLNATAAKDDSAAPEFTFDAEQQNVNRSPQNISNDISDAPVDVRLPQHNTPFENIFENSESQNFNFEDIDFSFEENQPSNSESNIADQRLNNVAEHYDSQFQEDLIFPDFEDDSEDSVSTDVDSETSIQNTAEPNLTDFSLDDIEWSISDAEVPQNSAHAFEEVKNADDVNSTNSGNFFNELEWSVDDIDFGDDDDEDNHIQTFDEANSDLATDDGDSGFDNNSDEEMEQYNNIAPKIEDKAQENQTSKEDELEDKSDNSALKETENIDDDATQKPKKKTKNKLSSSIDSEKIKNKFENFKNNVRSEINGKPAPKKNRNQEKSEDSLNAIEETASNADEENLLGDDEEQSPTKSKCGGKNKKSLPQNKVLSILGKPAAWSRKFLLWLLGILGKIPIVGKYFNKIAENNKLVWWISRAIPFIIVGVLFHLMHSGAPTTFTENTADSGAAVVSQMKYDSSSNTVEAKINNTGDVILTVQPSFTVKATTITNIPSWLSPQVVTNCQATSPNTVNIGEQKTVTAKCSGKVSGISKQITAKINASE